MTFGGDQYAVGTGSLVYSGTSLQGTPSGLRHVSPEWRLGWGLITICQ